MVETKISKIDSPYLPQKHAPPPLRIAFIGQKGLPASWGGIEHHVDEIATRLAARGHHVTAYVRKWYTQSTDKSYKNIRLITRPTIYTKNLDAGIHSVISSVDAMARSFDVVHYHGIGPSLFCMMPRITGKKVVATVHRLDYNGKKWGGIARAALYWGERSAFCFANAVTVISLDLEEYYKSRGLSAIYLPSGVIVSQKLSGAEILQTQYGLKGNDFLLYIGRWDHDKRVRELVEAFLMLKRPKVKLVVAGDSNKAIDYRKSVIAAAQSSPDIIFPGYVKGQLKAELLSNAFGFVTASEHATLQVFGHRGILVGLNETGKAPEHS